MKTNFRNLAIALFLSLVTIGVNATELNTTTEIEPAMVLEDWMIDETLFETKNNDLGANSLVDLPVSNPDLSILVEAASIEIEPAMVLEDWMIDETLFETKNDVSRFNSIVDVTVSNPDLLILVEAASIETEPAMEIESWMTDQAVFEIKGGDKCSTE